MVQKGKRKMGIETKRKGKGEKSSESFLFSSNYLFSSVYLEMVSYKEGILEA